MALRSLLPPPLVGLLTVVLMSTCISMWFVIMLPFIAIRLLPNYRIQRWASARCVQIATWWVGSNKAIYALMHGQQGELIIRGQFKPQRSYLVISNHSAWADIVVLFDVLHGHAPFSRFFLKQELIWVPIIGVVCWAMDFPFMRRHSREKLARNPELASQDLQTTRKACEVYKTAPVTVINFLEGTRFSESKRASKKSTYANLLNPKYGGLGTTMEAMGEQFAGVVNITIVYDRRGGHTTWRWLCGQQQAMRVVVEVLDTPTELIKQPGQTETEFKQRFKAWVNTLWSNKDQLIVQLKQSQRH